MTLESVSHSSFHMEAEPLTGTRCGPSPAGGKQHQIRDKPNTCQCAVASAEECCNFLLSPNQEEFKLYRDAARTSTPTIKSLKPASHTLSPRVNIGLIWFKKKEKDEKI